jgi:hypothetical protein
MAPPDPHQFDSVLTFLQGSPRQFSPRNGLQVAFITTRLAALRTVSARLESKLDALGHGLNQEGRNPRRHPGARRARPGPSATRRAEAQAAIDRRKQK